MSDLRMLKFTDRKTAQPLLVNAANIASIRGLEAGGCFIMYAVGSQWVETTISEDVDDIEQRLRMVRA